MDNLALIILNYNSAIDTIRCVEQLLKIGGNYRIIIVDNHSTDNSLKILKNKFSRISQIDLITTCSNGGYSSGNNFGIKYAMNQYKIDYIGILNPDVIIPELKVFQRMISAMIENPQIGIIGASVINAEGYYNPNLSCWDIPTSKEIVMNHFLINKRKYKSNNFKLINDKIAQVECVAGCFFIAQLDVLQKVNYLDENVFLYNEENILGLKLKAAGYLEAVVLDQFYIHNHIYKRAEKISLKKKILTTKNAYKSRKYLCSTYYSKGLLPALWLIEIMNMIYLFICYIYNIFKNGIRNGD